MDQEREIAPGNREQLLTAAVLAGLALFLGSELLSLFGALRQRPWVALYWLAVIGAGARVLRIRFRPRGFDPMVAVCCAAIGIIVTLTAVTAWFSPPNSSDAMAYHMPRVIYWAEQGSIRFFPTQYLNQIMLQPLAEYAMLHLYVLTGSDHFINFVQWSAALGSIVGVSAVAKELGASARGQAIAALFCATLPAGILAASGAKNEWVLALWLICAAYFALRGNALLLGIATGCVLLTKGTAYLFAPPLLLAILAARVPLRRAALAMVIALGINAPHYVRNYDLSGSILGYDSAQGDGFFRWRNETFGWKQTVSNGLRHLSEQLAARSDNWNQRVFRTTITLHKWLGIDPEDPAATWPGAHYLLPKNANHETDAPNRWHLLALLAVACLLPKRAATYLAGIVAGFAAFCFYLKWQQFMGRLLLPLFAAAAPLVGVARFKSTRVTLAFQVLLCWLLLDGTRLPALQNWVRPLQGPRSVLRADRASQYFSDLQPWMNQASFEKSAALVIASGCRKVGIDITNLQLEYPLMALVREKAPDTVFLHTGVENTSKRYPPPVEGTPCAVACLDCLNDASRRAQYSNFPRSIPVDQFVLFFLR
jgi:hypothetical protein